MEHYDKKTTEGLLDIPLPNPKASLAFAEIFTKKDKPDFDQPVPDPTGLATHQTFRNVIAATAVAGSRAVLYEANVISTYLTEKFPEIIARHEAHMGQKPEGFDWMLAFYWTIKNDGHVSKLAFEVVPVLANKDAQQVLDYFNPSITLYDKQISATDPANIYDEGHLWP